MLPEPYNSGFKEKSSEPILAGRLINYIREIWLNKYGKVVELGGQEYRIAMVDAFGVELHFLFAGLLIGKATRAIKEAIGSAD